jgi:hypothetical protein
MDELTVERDPASGTHALQPGPVSTDADFRLMTELDATRSELLLAHAVVFVEGLTEQLVLPFAFAALGHDVDRDAISIVECGGKPNIRFLARICGATAVAGPAGRRHKPQHTWREFAERAAGKCRRSSCGPPS